MKRLSQKRNLRAAFTLVELIVVIGLMGMLATVSVTGYTAASKGMKGRSVVQDVSSTLRLAMQTAVIDNKPTAVLFYNRAVKKEGDDEVTVTGLAIVIRQAGRLSVDPSRFNNLLIDEFADWYQTYPKETKDANVSSMRFYRMNSENELKKGREDCSSLVHTYITATSGFDEFLVESGARLVDWVNARKLQASDNKDRTGSTYEYGNNYFWGFSLKDGDNLGWHAGDAYGMEIASVQLPEGYSFGSSIPSSEGDHVAEPRAIMFRPSEVTKEGMIPMGQTVTVAQGRTWTYDIDDQLLKDK